MLNDFLDYLGQAPAPAHKKAPKTQPQPQPKTADFVRAADIVPAPVVLAPVKAANQPAEYVTGHNAGLILVEGYSERSFAIFGDTKPMKAKLNQLGGKFNPWLKKDGVATPGYIFSVTRLDSVKQALNL